MLKSKTASLQVYSNPSILELKTIKKDLEAYKTKRTSSFSLLITLASDQYAWIFSFGSIVFIGVPESKQESILSKLGFLDVKKSIFESEDFIEDDCKLLLGEEEVDVKFNKILLRTWDLDLLYIIALVLAQSCRLEILEKDVENILKESSSLTNNFSLPFWKRAKRRQLKESLGKILKMRHDLINSLKLLHDPESTWKKEECNKLFLKMYSFYEMKLRFEDVEKMLALASDNIGLQLSFLDTRHGELLEIIIILLIAFEILQTLLDLFLRL